MDEQRDGSNTRFQEDASLVKAFLAEDKNAFDRLVLKYKDKVLNLCYRILGDYEEASDCAQETFVKVYRSLKSFRFESSFSTWLYRIAVNTCKNKLTSLQYRYSRMMVRLDEPGNPEQDSHSIEIGNDSLSPVTELERKEKGRFIQEAIDSLPKEQKTVIVLRDIEGMSYEDIAKITGFNLGTVKSKLARARQVLREKLRGLI
jgi:RNA polymerase sigma-70 factor (ECF subfamily)